MENKADKQVNRVVLTGLMTGLILVSTMLIRVHVPFTQGYVHLGDAAIFMSVLIVGKKSGTFASGVGSAMADLLSGYAYYAPWTFVVKALMAYVVGFALERNPVVNEKGKLPLGEILAMFFGGLEMTVGYYIAASLMHGNWYSPLFSIPGNIGQFVVGMILATSLAQALYRTPAKKYFAIKQ